MGSSLRTAIHRDVSSHHLPLEVARLHSRESNPRAIAEPHGFRGRVRGELALILLRPRIDASCRRRHASESRPSTSSDGLTRENLEMRVIFTKNIGMLLLGIWLILFGLVGYVPLVASLGILINFLAIAAGVLILIGR